MSPSVVEQIFFLDFTNALRMVVIVNDCMHKILLMMLKSVKSNFQLQE